MHFYDRLQNSIQKTKHGLNRSDQPTFDVEVLDTKILLISIDLIWKPFEFIIQ